MARLRYICACETAVLRDGDRYVCATAVVALDCCAVENSQNSQVLDGAMRVPCHFVEYLVVAWNCVSFVGELRRWVFLFYCLVNTLLSIRSTTYCCTSRRDDIQGVAARGCYDLTQHQDSSGKSMEYFDERSKTKYVPHVIEPSLGVDRLFLAVMVSAYHEDEVRYVCVCFVRSFYFSVFCFMRGVSLSWLE